MKKYKILGFVTLLFLAGCNNEKMTLIDTAEGPVQLASVSVGSMTRGSIDNGEFAFDNEDKVVMTATVNSSLVSNTFTYNGGKWTQDAPVGDYRSIYVQDSPTINSIVSYGGKAEGGIYTDQSSMESYAMASSLAADPMRYLGDITIDGNVVTARLDHDNSDLALKVYDGYDEKNTLVENTPVMKVIIDEDGSSPDSKLLTFTAWNAGKSTDSYGTYTLFRVQLPAGCSILEAELSNVNETAGGLKTDILFRASDGQPSNEIDLEAGRRYSASYTYDMLKTVATVNVSISPFEGGDLGHDITASKDWSFDETTKTYTVFTAEGLQIVNKDIAQNIATKGDYNITLAADITLPDPVAPETSNWTMLGKADFSSYPYEYFYEGTFDGAGHTIRNLQINNPTANEAALVYALSNNGTVKNLTLENPLICSGNYAAGITALYSLDGLNVSITNCHIKGGSIKGAEVGGFIANSTGNIIACTVSGTTIEGYTIGGIASIQNFQGKIIACGVNEVKFIPLSNNAWVGGIVGYMNASSWDGEDTYIYSCYVKDCTKGTDLQALEGTANLMAGIRIFENCTATMYNCAYRTKGSSITYGVGGIETGPTDNDYTVDQFITETGTPGGDWTTAVTELNAGINFWNSIDSTLPCNWEWDATEEGKLKVKQ